MLLKRSERTSCSEMLLELNCVFDFSFWHLIPARHFFHRVANFCGTRQNFCRHTLPKNYGASKISCGVKHNQAPCSRWSPPQQALACVKLKLLQEGRDNLNKHVLILHDFQKALLPCFFVKLYKNCSPVSKEPLSAKWVVCLK